jgi:NAD(P)H-flavin reductase
VYKDLFEESRAVGLKTVYVATDAAKVPPGWTGRTGYIDKAMIEAEVPGHESRAYYLSGPPGMVDSYKALLKSLGVGRRQIKMDYFPGY